MEKSQQLFEEHYERSRKHNNKVNRKVDEEMKGVRRKPKINKRSKYLVNRDEEYVPIHKRIGRIISQRKANVGRLNNICVLHKFSRFREKCFGHLKLGSLNFSLCFISLVF